MDEFTTVGEQLQLNATESGIELASRTFNAKLAAIRAQNPFVPILPFPDTVLSFKLTANTAVDINLPSGTKLVLFSGNGEYFITRKGTAVVPSTAAEAEGSGAIMNPELNYYYVEEIRQFSAIAPYDMRLTVHCFIQL